MGHWQKVWVGPRQKETVREETSIPFPVPSTPSYPSVSQVLDKALVPGLRTRQGRETWTLVFKARETQQQ